MTGAEAALFFASQPQLLPLYEAVAAHLTALAPDIVCAVQKTQITFRGNHVFAAVSLPRAKRLAQTSVVLTLGLPARLESPRVWQATEPYPGRWTHHFLIAARAELDGEMLGWMEQAYAFSQIK